MGNIGPIDPSESQALPNTSPISFPITPPKTTVKDAIDGDVEAVNQKKPSPIYHPTISLLPPPEGEIDWNKWALSFEKVASSIKGSQHRIISECLDSWGKSIQEMAQLERKIQEKKRAEEVLKENSTQKEQQPSPLDLSSLSVSLGVSLVPLTALPLITLPSASLIAPLQTVAASLASSAALSIGAIPIVLSLSVGLLAAPLLAKAGTVFFFQNPKDASPKTLAHEFTKQIEKAVNDPRTSILLEKFFKESTPKGEKLPSPKQLEQQIVTVKAVLLMMAALAEYKGNFGGVTREEMAAVLGVGKEEMALDPDDPLKRLSSKIQILLQELPKEARTALLEAFLEYADTSPSLKEIMDPYVSVKSMLVNSKEWNPKLSFSA